MISTNGLKMMSLIELWGTVCILYVKYLNYELNAWSSYIESKAVLTDLTKKYIISAHYVVNATKN